MSAAPEHSRSPAPSDASRRNWLALADQMLARGDRAGADRAFGMHLQDAVHDPVLMRCSSTACTWRRGSAPRASNTR
jgi:hypothetical protein